MVKSIWRFNWRPRRVCLSSLIIVTEHLHWLHTLTNRLHFSVRVYRNRSQMTSQRVKNKKVRHETKSSGVTVVLYTLWRLLWSITVHTHGKCNLFVSYNRNSNGLLKDFAGMKKRKTSPLTCDLTWIWRHLCVCPLLDHGQQPMKMHTEVTLLYNVTLPISL